MRRDSRTELIVFDHLSGARQSGPCRRAGWQARGVRHILLIELERGGTEGLDQIIHAFDGCEHPVLEERPAEYRFLLDIARTSALLTRSNTRGLVRQPAETLPEHRAITAALRRADPMGAHEQVIQHMPRD